MVDTKSIQTAVNKYRDQVKRRISSDGRLGNLLTSAERATGVPKEYIFYAALVVILLYLSCGWGNNFICDLIGFCYPAWCSVRAIETTSTSDDTVWLMYWITFSMFHIVEYFSSILLFWIPLYWLMKCLALFWMMLPGPHGGSYILYHKIIKPFFLKHQATVDPILSKIDDKLHQASGALNDAAKSK